MPSLPKELDFSTPDGREATPERMNLAMEYIQAQIKALQSVVPEFESVINQLKATGLERLDEVLTPLLVSAQSMVSQITAITEAVNAPEWRADLIADVVAVGLVDPAHRAAFINDVIAAIDARDLYIRAADGTADVAMFTGAAAPSNALGKDGDLYVQAP